MVHKDSWREKEECSDIQRKRERKKRKNEIKYEKNQRKWVDVNGYSRVADTCMHTHKH